jgi:hypothetical protein
MSEATVDQGGVDRRGFATPIGDICDLFTSDE